jgi:anti-sigma regulatory factor (Ser/Thr protein kinase)
MLQRTLSLDRVREHRREIAQRQPGGMGDPLMTRLLWHFRWYRRYVTLRRLAEVV